MSRHRAGFISQLDRKLDRQQTKQRGELDARIHCYRRRILERIAHRVAHYRRIVKRRVLLLEFTLDHFLGVVPCPAGIRHEDRLIQTEHGDRDQITDKEERLDECKSKRGKENHQKDVEHALLCVLSANLNDLLAVLYRSFLDPFEFYIRFDELDCPVSAARHRLHRSAGEQVDDRASCYQTQHKRRVQKRKLFLI